MYKYGCYVVRAVFFIDMRLIVLCVATMWRKIWYANNRGNVILNIERKVQVKGKVFAQLYFQPVLPRWAPVYRRI